ncbi:MAG: 50S ribosomal protein L6 [Bacilli bacterium]|nr:50S ribosomal protein L6 [Bacilli bacterium]
MSRIGNKIIHIKAGVSVDVKDNLVTVKGPKGELSFATNPDIKVEIEGTDLKVTRPSDSIKHKTLHGTTRALINNMVEGVSEGYTRRLEIIGVGYKAKAAGRVLEVNAGYSHPVNLDIPEGLNVETPIQTEVVITGIDKQKVGQFASEVRAIRAPEPYKGKGIRYKGEVVRRKEGKKEKK